MRIPLSRLASLRSLVPPFLFLVAFAARLVYLNQIRHSPHFDAPVMDAAYHD